MLSANLLFLQCFRVAFDSLTAKCEEKSSRRNQRDPSFGENFSRGGEEESQSMERPTLRVHFNHTSDSSGEEMREASSQELELVVGARGCVLLRPPDTLEVCAGGPVRLQARPGI